MSDSVQVKQNSVVPESGPETVQRVLSSYDLGRKLRHLRMRKKIGLVDLGKHTGLSASMLSQLENGKLIPTLPTLARIAMVFDVGLEHFFSDRHKRALCSVIRRGERLRFPDRADAPSPAWFFECLAFSSQEKSLQAYLATFEPRERDQVNDHVHDGAEFIYVLDGSLAVVYAEDEIELQLGDSAYFDGSQPHGYRACGGVPATAIVVTTPPRL
ncbi:XRE family transcriptional regulator [uncultured Paludibaculum sp.]|uniref:helix-turn-helix domain-containing protein n=1 Tax=uncultured Paludibaculum sp. TaxID=1765020 RepID=UPI002AAA8CD5|nr:XRE family transcriptional regulator [uncultured Paludibaculum sp.]